MIWESIHLKTKATLFFENAVSNRQDDALFGLWCSLSIELLARAAVASVSPTLLAEPDRDHKNLLHVLGKGHASLSPRSIVSSQVVNLCQALFPGFSKEDAVAVQALINRRNSELHTAEAAFAGYPSRQWLPGFYHACQSLSAALGDNLESVLGKDEAAVAVEVLKQSKQSVLSSVSSQIAAYSKVFSGKTPAEQTDAKDRASSRVSILVFQKHHKVTCPACGSDATVEGDAFGPKNVTDEDGTIIIRQQVAPKTFTCTACGLKLNGYAELDAADLGGTYSRTTEVSPEDYYGLIDPENYEPEQEYDNE